ncbi:MULTISPECIES: tyrosine-type recombinase/integrase [Microbacterium]|uniref:tyrosine-type recombinase/integrase n=1 Tax=Microbacterium TaxID=33882 RepID=UPI001469CB5C|nr:MULTISPECIES: tyrosine-type recombinase/integrase [Microbacterium]
MGSVHPYNTNGGRRYLVRYRRPDHSQAAKRGFRSKRDAEAWLFEIESQRSKGAFVDPQAGRATVTALGERWIEAKRGSMKPSSFAPVQTAWRLRVKPKWGDWPVADIRFTDVRDWVSELRGEVGATVVLRTIGVLAGILDDAVLDGRIARNPVRMGDIGKPRKSRSVHRYLSHEQVLRLADAAGERRLVVLVLAYTGMRWAELTGLRVGDIDFGRRRINVTVNAVEVNGEFHVGTPKSHRTRSVPVPRFVLEELSTAVCDRAYTDLAFPGPDGSYMRRVRASSGSKSWFRSALRAAGLPQMTVHDLRHTAASLAVQSGSHPKAIQRMLGHASAAMTLDVYADLFDDDLDTVSHALDAAARDARDWLPPAPGGGAGRSL